MRENTGTPTECSLTGRTAVVTGGAQGIGRAITERFQHGGARVCILDCDKIAGEATAEELTAADPAHVVTFHPIDLEQLAAIGTIAQQIKSGYGRVDILVNNAGVELDIPFQEMTAALWDKILAINLRAPFLLTQALEPLFPITGGAVINISSIHASHAFASSTAYACSKAGLVALTRNLALELAPRHIRVNAICPGYIDTRLWEEFMQRSPDAEALALNTAALHPLGRRGVPADVANAAHFLASQVSAFITGTCLVVDGGLTIRAHS
ncbi:MAG TPA: SDR family oxidoreductase [Terracidiphilus sp.]|jgi:NAD(P)-dependent dehydrogenase (short-subunit alcohol dehydrogenase family)